MLIRRAVVFEIETAARCFIFHTKKDYTSNVRVVSDDLPKNSSDMEASWRTHMEESKLKNRHGGEGTG